MVIFSRIRMFHFAIFTLHFSIRISFASNNFPCNYSIQWSCLKEQLLQYFKPRMAFFIFTVINSIIESQETWAHWFWYIPFLWFNQKNLVKHEYWSPAIAASSVKKDCGISHVSRCGNISHKEVSTLLLDIQKYQKLPKIERLVLCPRELSRLSNWIFQSCKVANVTGNFLDNILRFCRLQLLLLPCSRKFL